MKKLPTGHAIFYWFQTLGNRKAKEQSKLESSPSICRYKPLSTNMHKALIELEKNPLAPNVEKGGRIHPFPDRCKVK